MSARKLFPKSVKAGIPRIKSVPKGWKVHHFSDVLKPIFRKANLHDEDSYQLVIAKRSRGGIVPRGILKGHKIKTKTQFYIQHNDFLISKRQIVHGACGVVPKELSNAIVSNEYSVLNPIDSLNIDFLKHFSHTDFFQMTCFQASVGVVIEKMIFNLDYWLKQKVALPPLAEQKKIAEVLDCWDLGIERFGKLIDAKRKLKKALMQQLLTCKKRFKEFKGKSWKEVRLGEIVSVRKERKENDGIHPLYSLTIEGGVTPKTDRYNREFLVKNQSAKKYKIVFPNDIVYNPSNLRWGAIAISKNEEPVLVSPIYEVLFVKNNAVYCHDFMSQLLTSSRQVSIFGTYAEGTLIERMAVKIECFKTIRVSIPEDIKEQQKIASVLNAADIEIELLCNKLEALKNQKKGLMQKLLTGKIRVKV